MDGVRRVLGVTGRSRRIVRGVPGICVVVCLLSCLPGCAGFEPLAQPDASAPDTFFEGKSEPTQPLSLNWPHVFGSPELDRLIAGAHIGNLDIAIAASRIAQAEALAGEAASTLYPSLSVSDSATQTLTPSPQANKRGNTSRSYSLGLTASYTLDIWGKNAATVEAAHQSAVQAKYTRDATDLTTTASVANTYFAVLASQDRLRIARENIRSADRILGAIKGRMSVGTATLLDVAQQESTLATQRASIPPLEQTISQSRSTLAVLLGLAPEQLPIRGGSLDNLRAPRIASGVPSQLLNRRPDVAAAESGLLSGKANVDAAKAAFFPSIDLTARGGLQSAALKTLFLPDAEFYSLAASLTQPIFDGFNLENTLQYQRSKYQELLQTYRKAIIQAFSDVDTALVAVRKTTEHERLQADVVSASRRAYQISEERLREGTIDIVTLLTTQSTLFQAQDQLVQVRLQRFQAIVSLYQALGGGWTREDVAALSTGAAK